MALLEPEPKKMSYEKVVQQVICPALEKMFQPKSAEPVDVMQVSPRYFNAVGDAVALERAISDILVTHAGFSELVLQRAFGLPSITIGDVLTVGPQDLEAFIEPLEGGLPLGA